MNQEITITSGIAISVSPSYREDLSRTENNSFFFTYTVRIENRNEFAVQLVHRSWYIFDSLQPASEVEGPGVVGEQPELQPGEVYEYTSGCELRSEFGYMEGFYTFRMADRDKAFLAKIGRFELEFPPRLN